jgi:hypothetical protein
MKYYKGNVKMYYDKRIASNANGEKIPNAEFYFNKIRDGEIILDAPIFNYFYLQSYDDKRYWEWKLFDVCNFIGEGSQIYGWLISDKLKKIFQEFSIAQCYHFYASNLLYRKQLLNCWIFQYADKHKSLNKSKYINFENSQFTIDNLNNKITIQNYNEFISKSIEFYNKLGKDIKFKVLSLNEYVDFLPLNSMSSDKLFSQKLKENIEENGIEGFEFSELDYEVVIEK